MYRVGVIGTSWITEQFLDACASFNNLKPYVVVSRNYSRGMDFADRNGLKFALTSVEELVVTEPDIVYVASPNSIHFEQVKKLLESGIHVICEKPIFSNINELEEIKNIADQHHVMFFEAIRNIYNPLMQDVKDAIIEEGGVKSAYFNFVQLSSKYSKYIEGDIAPVFSKDYSGGVMVDLGVYIIYAALELFGMPLDYYYNTQKLGTGVDGEGVGSLIYDGFEVEFEISKMRKKNANSIIKCISGNVEIDNLGEFSPILIDGIKTEIPLRNDMYYMLKHFIDVIYSNNQVEYEKAYNKAYSVLKITQDMRYKNNIKFACEE